MIRFIASCIIIASLLSGCGYRFAGEGIELPGSIASVHIKLFENRTKEPYLESVLTESVTYRLARMHNISLVEAPGQADAVLSGEVIQYQLNASAYDRNDAIETYRVTIKVAARLSRVSDGKILWQGESVRFDDFVSSGADITTVEGLERATLRVVAGRIAEDLSWQMASGFGAE